MPRAPIAERLTAQALAGEPLRSPEAVAQRLLAVQGQDPRGARLAVERDDGLVELAKAPPAAPIPPPRLLGAFAWPTAR